MKIFFKIILFALIPAFALSQFNSMKGTGHNLLGTRNNIHRVSITEKLSDPEFQKKAIDKTFLRNPELFQKRMNQSLAKTADLKQVIGDKKQYLAYNDITGGYDNMTFVFYAQGSIVNIWVDTTEIINGHITLSNINQIIKTLEISTLPTSRDSTKGILKIDNDYFGFPPNINSSGQKGLGDGRLDVLIYDIKDDFESSGGYIAGYFNPNDQNATPGLGNKKDIIYIDTYPTIFYKDVRDITMAMQTMSHEYQHLIHYNYDPSEAEFVNEACSQNSEIICGYNAFNGVPEFEYFNATNVNLLKWDHPSKISDYSRATLWLLYLIERLGDSFTKTLVQNSNTGLPGITSAISQVTTQYSFYDLFKDWSIANYLNDKKYNDFYGYKYGINGKPNGIVHVDAIANDTSYVNTLAVKYIIFKNQATNFRFRFVNVPNSVIINMIKIGPTKKSVTQVYSGPWIDVPELATDYTSIVFVLTNQSTTQAGNFIFNSTGEAIIKSEEITYDDGKPKDAGGFSYLMMPNQGDGWAARFTPRYSKNLLRKVRLWVAFGQEFENSTTPTNAPKQFEFHVWKAENDSTPGEDLIPPILYEVNGRTTLPTDFTDINLSGFKNELTNINGSVFCGFLENDEWPTNIGINNYTAQNYSFVKGLSSDGQWYSLNQLSVSGTSGNVSLKGWNVMIRADFLYDLQSGVKEITEERPGYSLSQNYPNPFNPETRIEYTIIKQNFVKLAVYDLLGRKIRDLVTENQNPGKYMVTWNGESNSGQKVSSGVYIYKLESGDYTQIKKLNLIK
jgi:hypothetical protein